MKLVNRVGHELDAEFVVEPLAGDVPGFDVVLRSRTGGRNSANRRNPDYFEALE